jgi:hypothetical protein
MAGIYDADSVLRRLDIADVIKMLDGRKNPFLRLLGTGPKPIQMTWSWPGQVDASFGFAGALDGADKVDGYGHSNRDEIQAAAMKLMSEGWHVSDFKEDTETHGVKDEVAKQRADDLFNLSRMMEKQLTSTQAARRQSVAGGYQSGGLFWWLDPVQTLTSAAYLQTPAAYRCSAATRHTAALDALTEDAFEAMLRTAAEEQNSVVDLTGYVGTELKKHMTNWLKKTTVVTGEAATLAYNLNAKEKELASTVDFFTFDSGSVRTFPAFNLAADETTGAKTAYSTRSGAFVDLSRWRIRYIRKPTHVAGTDNGGGPRGYHKVTYGLECDMPRGQLSVYTNASTT